MAFHGDNAVKAFVKYDDGSNSVDDSFNVSSVTNHATGQITVNFDTNMSSSNYCTVSANAGVSGTLGVQCFTSTNYSGVAFDSSYTSSSSQRFNIVSSNPTGITQSVKDIGIAFLEND
tara:strand:- start:1163 stop:1516 length:354 start_codon:yes stop_codon:yes gene_type:complete